MPAWEGSLHFVHALIILSLLPTAVGHPPTLQSRFYNLLASYNYSWVYIRCMLAWDGSLRFVHALTILSLILLLYALSLALEQY